MSENKKEAGISMKSLYIIKHFPDACRISAQKGRITQYYFCTIPTSLLNNLPGLCQCLSTSGLPGVWLLVTQPYTFLFPAETPTNVSLIEQWCFMSHFTFLLLLSSFFSLQNELIYHQLKGGVVTYIIWPTKSRISGYNVEVK